MRVLCLALLPLGWLAPLPLQAQQADAPLRLVHCTPASRASCLTATIRLTPAARRATASVDSVTEAAGWSGTLAGTSLIGPGVVPVGAKVPVLAMAIASDSRILTFELDEANSPGLARSAWTGMARLRLNGDTVASVPLTWRPPLFALPAFAGTAEPFQLTQRMRESVGNEATLLSQRGLVGLCLFISIAGLWLFVPRLIWIRGADVIALGGMPLPASPTQQMVALGRGIVGGEDVKEAAARQPDEITKQTARRSARRR